jgi:hypothetical protein
MKSNILMNKKPHQLLRKIETVYICRLIQTASAPTDDPHVRPCNDFFLRRRTRYGRHFPDQRRGIMAQRTSFSNREEDDAADRSGMIEPLDVAEAARRYAPGTLLPMKPVEPPPQGFWSRVTESISGITLISALLAFIFGALGLLKPDAAQGWLDIAKIFAGAVVGSAGASVAAAVRGK